MGLVKKDKKPLGKIRGTSTGTSGVETSPLRPTHVPKLAPCRSGCPNGTKIREVLLAIAQTEDRGRTYDESYRLAFEILAERNPFPAVCGRVCPHPCEENCNRQYKDGALNIHSIERFIGDYALQHNFPLPKLTNETYPEKIAVIGAGPAGLSCAYQLARRGYKVTVFEAFSKPGGMLRYGIPKYRLPEDVLDKEIQRIVELGVEIKCNTAVGRDIPYETIRDTYDAVFVGIGAHKGKSLGLPGEDAPNVFTGTEFLNKVNSGQRIDVGKKVLVVGGGDTAIDAARVSRRLGADVTILYRRTRTEMPAIEEEIVGAEEEGVNIVFLVAPKELILEDGKVKAVKCQKMQLGEPDESGRRRPVPIEGAEETYECDTLIAAISQEPDFYGLDYLREGNSWIKVDENFRTKDPKVYSGGDDLELGLVTIAIYQGRMAAETIHSTFRGIPIEKDPELSYPLATKDRIVFTYYTEKYRNEALRLPPDERLAELEKEITCTLTEEQVIDEARRCMSCGSCFDCGTCWSICQDQVIHKPVQRFQTYTFKLELCKGCNKCAEACPCGYIEMKDPFTGQIAPRDPETGKVIYAG
ncbi:FAD-dependent oxidoreductase [Bacteroidetes/Chlorobi group bacterium MS-B_bin-24]|jgi:formate dehydrogenase major subunit|nr:MAG: FAD-dependent oxidoreductase [Bacteroidetes/Chlorobi group bacterium MS-B_bin-24]